MAADDRPALVPAPAAVRTVRSRTTLYKFWIWARLIACETASVERRQNLQQIALQHLHTSTQICVFTPSNNRWLGSQHCNLVTCPLPLLKPSRHQTPDLSFSHLKPLNVCVRSISDISFMSGSERAAITPSVHCLWWARQHVLMSGKYFIGAVNYIYIDIHLTRQSLVCRRSGFLIRDGPW